MIKKRFLIDCDGILFDFSKSALKLVSEYRGKETRVEDFSEWDFFGQLSPTEKAFVEANVKVPGWCASLQPIPGAQEALAKLQELVDVYPVTSPYFGVSTWVNERYLALEQHFGVPWTKVLVGNPKFLVDGDFFLEDNPAQVEEWGSCHPNAVAMLWDYPHTRGLEVLTPYTRVKTWDDVLQVVQAKLA